MLPQKRDSVAGAMIGIADFDWSKSESTILPGAIVEHLTSFGGVMTAGAGQTPLTEFLRHGAAGSSGTVTEPYAIQAKFPSPFIHVHYASGVSLAEAFYLSVAGPYQLLIVGDPLCNPWRRELNVSLDHLPEQGWQGTVMLRPRIERPSGVSVAGLEIYVDGERVKGTTSNDAIELDTKKLSDGAHQLTVVAVAGDAVETVGRWTMDFTVRNEEVNRQAVLRALSGPDYSLNKSLELEARCSGATELVIRHLGRDIARMEGESGTFKLDPKQLGSGPVKLHLLAMLADKTTLRTTVSLPIQP